MISYSIVIPTYGRNDFLKDCLKSIEAQILKPKDFFIIDNNNDININKDVESIINDFHSDDINFNYHKGDINSGAVARNYGASLVNTDLVAFLDDDVLLDNDYYKKIVGIFNHNAEVVGAQGIDRSLIESYKLNIKNRLLGKFWQTVENFLENGTVFKKNNSSLRPSLAVVNPIPDEDFCVESEWISTCAGVFRTKLFEIIEFPNKFVKYSWNEYVFFSHNIFKKKLGKMIHTSDAKYRNIPTDEGRLPQKELVYMAEVYDLYVFNNLFNRNLSDKLIYLKSRFFRFVIYFARALRARNFDFSILFYSLNAFYITYRNRDEIKSGNFRCYNERFPID